MKRKLQISIEKALQTIGITEPVFKLDYPDNPDHGDFSCNAAMVYAKQLKIDPKDTANKLIAELQKELGTVLDFVESITVAGPGFINFKIKDSAFVVGINLRESSTVSHHTSVQKKKVMVEYTDPNPFKIFHIGHLMANAIGESVSRLIESDGVDVVRACYQGDVGLHVAKTIWAIKKHQTSKIKNMSSTPIVDQKFATVTDAVKWLGEMYVYGSQFDDDVDAQKDIAVVNKHIFNKTDAEINEIYTQGRAWSLEYFDTIYARVGTRFDQFYFESEVADNGVKVVKEFLQKGVFVESDGAIVFKGEDHGLHTRVFITSQGLPTYEAKEMGLNIEKFKKYPDLDQSIIITANEQNAYFKVILKAFSLIDTSIFEKTKHMSHGILRFTSGKMSSRKGNIISAETLISEIRDMVIEKMDTGKMQESGTHSEKEKYEIVDAIAIGAIKYTILRQSIGGDVIFDSVSSISFEGDSGPYLQYSAVRARALLEKAVQDNIVGSAPEYKAHKDIQFPKKVTMLEKLLSRYDDILEHARIECAPQHIAQYLTALAGEFNAYYATHQIVNEHESLSAYRVQLTKKFLQTMTQGLWLLGIKVPSRM